MPKPTAAAREKERAARVEARAAQRAEFREETAAQREQMKRAHLRRQAPEQILLRSRSMAVFELTVDDKGKLTTREVVPAELTPR